MEFVKKVMKDMNVTPKLRLGIRVMGPKGKMVVKSTGPHTVKFLSEPTGVTGRNFEGQPSKMLRFSVEENGEAKAWYVAILNKEGEPSYLLERVSEINIGDVRVLELKKAGPRNYVEIRKDGEESIVPDAEDLDDVYGEDEQHG